jgi:hypothetical protein
MNGRLGRRERALAVIAASAIGILAAGLIYLQIGSTLAGRISGTTAAVNMPLPKPSPSPWNGPCPPTELKLAGIFQECASVDFGMNCPTGSFDKARVLRMHGTKHDFILYVEVNGAYDGPRTYALVPWPSETLGVPDGVAKVAIREWTTGRFWESTAGSLTINESEESGWVYAGLGASAYSPMDVQLNIAGWWSCSEAKLPAPRNGASACLPTSSESTMLEQLANKGISVTAATASNDSTLFPQALSVCMMDVGKASFTVAFFRDESAAYSVRVCERRSGSRYLYQVGGLTVDSAKELRWSVAGDAVLWTDNADLDTSLRLALHGLRPSCFM